MKEKYKLTVIFVFIKYFINKVSDTN